MLPFADMPLTINLVVFAGAAIVVWIAGTRLSSHADVIATETGLGRVFIGALLLGGITSLPEGATTVSASLIGNAPLAVNNLIGGVAIQVTILAAADAYLSKRALSTSVREASVLLQGVLLIVVLSLAALGIAAGDVLVLGVGVWSLAIFLTAIVAFYLVHRQALRGTWEVNDAIGKPTPAPKSPPPHRDAGAGLRTAVVGTVAAGGLILVAGIVLAHVGDVLAEQTGLGSSFVGAVFVAISTSLPEVSTTLAAVRLGVFSMAFGGIFGTNVLDIAILFLADVVYPGGPVLNEVGRFSIITAVLGILLTAVYVVGMLERRQKLVLGMGLDSVLVLVLYLGGLVVLYNVR